MLEQDAIFQVGQIIRHKLFDYTGVIFDVDSSFQGAEEWYREVALSRPPKDKPWYHVLVNNAFHTTYVAEQNLEPSEKPGQIIHPHTDKIFKDFDGQRYHLRQKTN